jgi:hypothetical protein
VCVADAALLILVLGAPTADARGLATPPVLYNGLMIARAIVIHKHRHGSQSRVR